MTRSNTTTGSAGRRKTPSLVHHNAWFPGRVIGGTALVLGPVVWLAGLILRYLALSSAPFTAEQLDWFARQPFAAPSQLAVYLENSALTTAGYGCFAAGAILLCPAIITLAQIVAAKSPKVAFVGGTLIVVGLFSRLYWAGVDHTAFELIGSLGLDQVTKTVMDTYVDISYGPWRVPITAAFGLYIGTLVLAVGAYRSATFGTGRLLLFLLSGTLWTGVLKESTVFSIVSAAALCLVFVPLGIRVLRNAVPELRVESLPASDRAPLTVVSW
ncbi:hypothetical protein [Saccharomonospora cyanea]|uniref:Uncharacterized protein n=1 Tax=Saccharomonospora cyanea NA-134 TaxID=882082 RepID=H5XN30_9PSEU|nr:hypothetical protein [Saccharomonospora cyanea]EHR63197.1 hypothetical protein SaccyDRAFT_4386 [Saccharomonospora cyanea NA-134]